MDHSFIGLLTLEEEATTRSRNKAEHNILEERSCLYSVLHAPNMQKFKCVIFGGTGKQFGALSQLQKTPVTTLNSTLRRVSTELRLRCEQPAIGFHHRRARMGVRRRYFLTLVPETPFSTRPFPPDIRDNSCYQTDRDSSSVLLGRSGDRIPVAPNFPHPSRPAQGPTQPPKQFASGLIPRSKSQGVALNTPI